jgi:hypothetical protein
MEVSAMASEFDLSLLAIVADTRKLLGTSFVIAANRVLTCAHLFDEHEILESGRVQLPTNVVALFGEVVLRPSRVFYSQARDLCCLWFPEIPGAVPIPLMRSTRLHGSEITTVGFVPDQSAPRRHVVHDGKVIHELQSGSQEWLQSGQLQGGWPEGFSGGPVLAKTSTGWGAVGMMQLGRAGAATSRFIGVDPIGSFLGEHGLNVAIGELPPLDVNLARTQGPDRVPIQGNNNSIGSITGGTVSVNQTQTFGAK